MNRFGVLLAIVTSEVLSCSLKSKTCRADFGEGWKKDGEACECYCPLDAPLGEDTPCPDNQMANGSCESCSWMACDACECADAEECAMYWTQATYADGGDCACMPAMDVCDEWYAGKTE